MTNTPTLAWLYRSLNTDSSMDLYLNTHYMLDKRRGLARDSNDGASIGPRVVLVGPTDCGKSSLARILLNYAIRTGGQPTYVDLDPGRSSICIFTYFCKYFLYKLIGISSSLCILVALTSFIG